MNNQTLNIELKRLLASHEIAHSKVVMCNDRCENNMQQAAADRLYRKANNFATLHNLDIINIHREVIIEITQNHTSKL
jgi:hypothetical protein